MSNYLPCSFPLAQSQRDSETFLLPAYEAVCPCHPHESSKCTTLLKCLSTPSINLWWIIRAKSVPLKVRRQLKGRGMTVLKWHLRSQELSRIDPFLLKWPLTTPNSLSQLSEHSSMHSGATPILWPMRDLCLRLVMMTNQSRIWVKVKGNWEENTLCSNYKHWKEEVMIDR